MSIITHPFPKSAAKTNNTPAWVNDILNDRSAKPRKFIFFPLACLLSHMGRCLEIGKALRARGHEVVFAGEHPDHPRTKMHLAVEEGFRVVYTKEPDYRYAWDRFERYGWMMTAWDLMMHQKWAPLDEIMDSMVQVMLREKPDMVIGDASIAVSNAAYITGTPAAGIMNAYASNFINKGSYFRPMIHAWDTLTLSRIRNRVYKKYDVKPVNAIQLLRSMRLISPDLEGYYIDPPYLPNFHTVGPIYAEPKVDLPEWFNQLDDGTPNIYVTMGSTGLFDRFLKANAEALGKLPYRFVVTTGGQVSKEIEESLPSNFLVTKYAPGGALAKKCQAMIFHGGNGSTYQALEAGIPMVALPCHQEQDVLVGIGEHHGYLIRVSARNPKPAKVVDALQKIMNEPSYRQAAQMMSAHIKRADGPGKAATLLEDWAAEARPAGWQFLAQREPMALPAAASTTS